MTKWFKYNIVDFNSKIDSSIDNSIENHSESLTINNVDNPYQNKELFYKTYFYNYHQGRLEDYDDFLLKFLNKNDKVLSLASGRSANELRLIDKGYNIYSSDLYKFKWYLKTKSLWPNYRFKILDITKTPSSKTFDSVISLSLIFIFNDQQLNKFFQNVNKSLNKNGYLYLDSAGSPDNFLNYIIHDVILKYEAYLITIIKNIFFKNVKKTVIKKHHGFKRNNKKIIEFAKNNGFKLIKLKNYSYLTDFKRSYFLNFLINRIPFSKFFFNSLGSYIPYVRMFSFKKIK